MTNSVLNRRGFIFPHTAWFSCTAVPARTRLCVFFCSAFLSKWFSWTPDNCHGLKSLCPSHTGGRKERMRFGLLYGKQKCSWRMVSVPQHTSYWGELGHTSGESRNVMVFLYKGRFRPLPFKNSFDLQSMINALLCVTSVYVDTRM